jgi:AraC family transcriptional regulator
MARAPGTYDAAQEASSSAERLRQLRYLDERLFEPLTLQQIAAGIGYSPSQLGRRFLKLHGESVMALVRRRRLEVAAERLAAGNVCLAELALSLHYGSQSAFTRAFTRAFGAPPAAVRSGGAPPPILEKTMAVNLAARTESRSFRLVGLTKWFEPSNYEQTSQLWRKAAQRFDFPGRVGAETIGAFRSRDAEGRFEHMAGVSIAPSAQVPDGFDLWEIGAQSWLVFRQTLNGQPLHLQVTAAAQEILERRLPSSGRRLRQGPDLQLYPSPFILDGGWLEHWSPVD